MGKSKEKPQDPGKIQDPQKPGEIEERVTIELPRAERRAPLTRQPFSVQNFPLDFLSASAKDTAIGTRYVVEIADTEHFPEYLHVFGQVSPRTQHDLYTALDRESAFRELLQTYQAGVDLALSNQPVNTDILKTIKNTQYDMFATTRGGEPAGEDSIRRVRNIIPSLCLTEAVIQHLVEKSVDFTVGKSTLDSILDQPELIQTQRQLAATRLGLERDNYNPFA